MNLVIVESPGKVKKISQILGSGWEVQASVGHVRDLPEKEMGVEAPEYRPKYVPTTRGKDVLAKLRKAVQRADEVYLATDMDREGEAIAWHLQQALKLKEPKRIVFSEITAKAIKAAISKPGKINYRRVAAQEGRRVLDRLVGYRVSPKLGDVTKQRGLSAGRVQSPAVRIVADRERAIQAFVTTDHYGARWNLGGWFADWDAKPFLLEGQEYLLDRSLAEWVANVTEASVIACEETQESKAPPAPFITSTLQQAASSRLKMKPKATMAAAQKLYEQGHITYMRTDTPNLSEEAFAQIQDYGRANGLPVVDRQRTWKAKGDAQEAHEAVRPTHIDLVEAGETSDQQQLYKLIWQRTLASQLQAAKYAVRTVKLRAGEQLQGKPVECVTKGRTELNPGWKTVYADDAPASKQDPEEAANPVPKLQEGQLVNIAEGKVLDKRTKPPSRFTEAQLIKELEKQGIGRPSTYAAIMENIMSRGYVTYDSAGKYLVPTDTGYLVVDCLVASRFSFIELDFTKSIEAQLDEVAEGRAGYKGVIATLDNRLTAELTNMDTVKVEVPAGMNHPCPECGEQLTRRPGKSSKKAWWGCSGYPECKVTLPDKNGKPGKPKEREVSETPCPKCGKELVRRKKGGKSGYDFWGCSGFPKCDGRINNE
ncbi:MULTISPECIES: type I DNA topoisomerase [Gilvimarinus]|uniref:type I DNA topoisomerase n=1 Tax=Gilvimarinus TaxID=940550 RepID=UPI0003761254|nr:MULTISPECIES: type I DNA topoisomerase [Gilvimarinus]UTF61247.1 type I DNA topoisomerase [Gilvimarinus sp. DA14]